MSPRRSTFVPTKDPHGLHILGLAISYALVGAGWFVFGVVLTVSWVGAQK